MLAVPRNRFSRTKRLTHAAEYQRAYDAKIRKHAGPLVIFAYAAKLPHARLGLAVSHHVGNAVTRNVIKRRIREAFRLSQAELPPIDLVVRVRPHDLQTVDEYRGWLVGAANRLGPRLTESADDAAS